LPFWAGLGRLIGRGRVAGAAAGAAAGRAAGDSAMKKLINIVKNTKCPDCGEKGFLKMVEGDVTKTVCTKCASKRLSETICPNCNRVGSIRAGRDGAGNRVYGCTRCRVRVNEANVNLPTIFNTPAIVGRRAWQRFGPQGKMFKRYVWEPHVKDLPAGWRKEKVFRPKGDQTIPEYAHKTYFRALGKTGRKGYDTTKNVSKWGWDKTKSGFKKGKDMAKSEKGGRFLKEGAKLPFRAVKETARAPRRFLGRRILKSRSQKSTRGGRGRKVFFALIPFVIGGALSAMLGTPFFFFGFVFWSIYIIMPEPSDPVKKVIERVEKKFLPQINSLKKQLDDEKDPNMLENLNREIDRKTNRMNALIESKVGGAWGILKQAGSGGGVLAKEMFKIAALVSFSLAFLTSNLPLAQVIGLIVSFIFYFSLGGDHG
jgi:hypothetical protein